MRFIRHGSSFALLAVSVAVMTVAGAAEVRAQRVVDKTVAVVRDANRTELITYSDLLWQLALQAGAPPLDPPRQEDLDQALQTVINQRLFALEAQRIPRPAPSKEQIAAEIKALLDVLGPPSTFQARLRKVGFDSISDPAFEELIASRLAIDNYVDFRFGSFVVVTADDEARYYRDVFVPEFRRNSPGSLLPTLDESRAAIKQTLTVQKIASAIETYLDEAKRRVNIEILIEP